MTLGSGLGFWLSFWARERGDVLGFLISRAAVPSSGSAAYLAWAAVSALLPPTRRQVVGAGAGLSGPRLPPEVAWKDATAADFPVSKNRASELQLTQKRDQALEMESFGQYWGVRNSSV